jgi:hypothetical protein
MTSRTTSTGPSKPLPKAKPLKLRGNSLQGLEQKTLAGSVLEELQSDISGTWKFLEMASPKNLSECRLVIAIDYGTTFTGE